MTINYSSGEKEKIELERVKSSGEGALSNGVVISKKIKFFLDSGFTLKSQSSGGTEIVHTMMVFTKE